MREKIIELLSDKDKPAKSAIELNDELGFVNIDEYKELYDLSWFYRDSYEMKRIKGYRIIGVKIRP